MYILIFDFREYHFLIINVGENLLVKSEFLQHIRTSNVTSAPDNYYVTRHPASPIYPHHLLRLEHVTKIHRTIIHQPIDITLSHKPPHTTSLLAPP